MERRSFVHGAGLAGVLAAGVAPRPGRQAHTQRRVGHIVVDVDVDGEMARKVWQKCRVVDSR